MNDCYIKNYRKYDWLIFYDIDEFIHLNNYSNVKYFLSNSKFKTCPLIYLNLVCHTDNGLLLNFFIYYYLELILKIGIY